VLIPKEHGAYGQLAFPLATALAAGRPTASALALATSAAAAFLAHESLLMILGQRGARAARERRRESWRSLLAFGGVAVFAGAAAVFTIGNTVRIALAVPVALACVLSLAVAVRQERTTAGECLVAVTLSSISLPVGAAAGLPTIAAFTIALVFAAVFAAATISVRAIIQPIARSGGPTRAAAAVVVAAAVGLLLLLGAGGHVSPGASVAALPVCAVCAGLIFHPPPARRLRTVGWALVTATAVTAIILVLAIR
jgi:hypothetical protein